MMLNVQSVFSIAYIYAMHKPGTYVTGTWVYHENISSTNGKLNLKKWILRTFNSAYDFIVVWCRGSIFYIFVWSHLVISYSIQLFFASSNNYHENDLAEHDNTIWPDMVKTVNDPLVEDRRWLNTSLQTGSPT
jgi:hypothetical protein